MQVWYGVASDIDANGLSFNAIGGNATQFIHDLDLMTPTVTVSGLDSETGYYFYVLPQTDTGLPLTETGEPLYCNIFAITDDANGEDICKINITPEMIIFDSNNAPTSIEGELFDQQNFFDFCSGFPLPVDNPDTGELDPDFIPWVDFNNPDFEGIELILDLQKYYHISDFLGFDRNGAGLFQINYGHTADGPWFPLHTYFTNGFNEWVNFSPARQPVEGVRYLQFINGDNNARLTELFICGEESCFLNANAVNENHCIDYDPQLALGWLYPGCNAIQFRVYNEPVQYQTIELWYTAEGAFVEGEHPLVTHPGASNITTQIEQFSIDHPVPSISYPSIYISGLSQNTAYHFAYRMLDNEGRSTPLYIMDNPTRTSDCLRPRFMIMGPMVSECSQVGVWWSLDEGQRGGHFEVIETSKRVEDPTKASNKYTRIEEDGTPIYQYLIDEKEKTAEWLYFRYTDEEGNKTDWIVWDLSIDPCKRIEGRSNNGVALGSIPFYTSGLQLYPNPTKDLLYLELEDTRYQKYQITDVMGKLRLFGNVNDAAGEMKLDVSQLQGGVYILQMEGEGIRAKSFKFVVSE